MDKFLDKLLKVIYYLTAGLSVCRGYVGGIRLNDPGRDTSIWYSLYSIKCVMDT